MNEVLAVIYYCYFEYDTHRHDEKIEDESEKLAVIPRKYHESCLFSSFTNIMVEMQDGFLRELDKEKNGIQGRIKQYAEIMRVVEPHAHHSIEQNQVNH